MTDPTISILALIVSVCTLLASVWYNVRNLKRSERTTHIQWLVNLQHQFYTNKDYEKVRNWIDYETAQFESILEHLKKVLDHEQGLQPHQDIEIFHAYLNFLEFVCYLHSRKQINQEEMDALFEWYLRDFKKKCRTYDVLKRYVKEMGFENLLFII